MAIVYERGCEAVLCRFRAPRPIPTLVHVPLRRHRRPHNHLRLIAIRCPAVFGSDAGLHPRYGCGRNNHALVIGRYGENVGEGASGKARAV